MHMGAFETWPQLEAALKIIGGLRWTAHRQIGGRAFEVSQVIVGIAGNSGVVVDEGVGSGALGEMLLGFRQQSLNWGVGWNVGGREGDGGRGKREKAGGEGQCRGTSKHGDWGRVSPVEGCFVLVGPVEGYKRGKMRERLGNYADDEWSPLSRQRKKPVMEEAGGEKSTYVARKKCVPANERRAETRPWR